MIPPSGRGNIPGAVRRVLAVTALGNFASSLFVRAIDPMIPQVAHDLVTDPATVALLTTAFALPYAVLQPVLGPLADMIGKTRLMTICLGALVINGFVSAAAPNFNVLMASRIASGIAAGGIFPIGLAIAGDLVPIHQRQVAISRLLAAGMLGNLLGTPMAGILGDLVGWRFVLAVVGFLCMATFVAAVVGFRGIAARPGAGIDLGAVVTGYRTIFRNPLAKYCFGAVMLEGTFMMGIFPYVALLLRANGEPRATIAGIVIAGFALGGVIYSASVSRLLPRIGERGLMLIGAAFMGLAMLAVALPAPWPVEMVEFLFLGCGFYMMHGVIQIYATELAPAARGSAAALHSGFFCLGLAIGPIYFGYGLAHAGLAPTVVLSATVMFLTGYVCAKVLRRSRPV
ncbi:MAG TPA: MFS transporter [Xanthobacteraceae bacterium]|nr:MFS transporter [Xanthobacteraceae bacterium]